MALPQQFLDELRMANDITSVVSSYVSLKRSSRNMVGLCPFHSEKSPSFTVFPNTETFHCFGCGAGGNAFTFVMEYENFTFVEALKYLAERSGVKLPEIEYSEDAKRAADFKSRLLEVNKLAAKFFYVQLKSEQGRPAYEYFKKRGLSDGTLGKIFLGTFAVKWHRDDAYYAANGGWRGTWEMDGGGSLMNQSIHTVDLMLRLMGKPKSITSQMRLCGHDIESEDLPVSPLTFESGAIATFTSTTCAYPGICTEISLTCENGYVALDADKLTMWKLRGASPEDEAEKLARYSVGNRKAQKLCRGRLFGHKRVVDDFCAAILEDREPAVTVEAGLLPLRVICAAYESAKTGKTVFFD